MERLSYAFFHRPCLEVARDLVGKLLISNGQTLRISETEAYCGEADTACHAHKGRTKRTEVMYAEAGTVYIYLCYGMHWMLNIVTGEENAPEAVLIRACEGKYNGPGKLTKALGITGQLNRGSIFGDELWIEDDGFSCGIRELPGWASATPAKRTSHGSGDSSSSKARLMARPPSRAPA